MALKLPVLSVTCLFLLLAPFAESGLQRHHLCKVGPKE
ncbi:MAG: hypothetical protein QOK03_993, partial [Candidatus Binataceae bacterium]|nr:hypothetical protein [Candidatus Binataceae bacterium]